MFDTLSHGPSLLEDRARLRREAAALSLTLGLMGTAVAGLVAGTVAAVVPSPPSLPDEPLIELALALDELEPRIEDLPEAPPAPTPPTPATDPSQVPAEAPATAPTPSSAPATDTPDDADDSPPPEDPQPEDLSDAPVEPEVRTSRFQSAQRPDALSSIYTMGGGSSGSTEAVHPLAHTVDTTIEHELPPGSVRVLRRKYPTFPSGAQALAGIEHRCIVEVAVGTDGVPYEIEVHGCPEMFHDQTRYAVARWRWAPPTKYGVPVRMRTTVEVNYRDFAGGR